MHDQNKTLSDSKHINYRTEINAKRPKWKHKMDLNGKATGVQTEKR